MLKFIYLIVLLVACDAFAADSRLHLISANSSAPDQVPAKGIGIVDKIILINNPGWYELFIHSAPWPTDLLLDGQLLGHFSFHEKSWPDSPEHKVLNIYLASGEHTLRIQRLYHPGLPYVRSVQIKPATKLSGKISLKPDSDRMVFRTNEPFLMNFVAERQSSAYEINFNVKDANSGLVVTTLTQKVPAGSGLFLADIIIPTNKEGVFNVDVRHVYFGQVARSFQYVAINTKPTVDVSQEIKKDLVSQLTLSDLTPDFASSSLATKKDNNKLYLESNNNGVYGNSKAPDYFAYKLNLPDSSGLYLVEIDYPDNAPRVFTISLVEKSISPLALDSGVITGGQYPLSNETQTARIYFYPRELQPRLLFLNWHQGKRIAVSEIRIYRVDESSLTALPEALQAERKFGDFYEEPMRFTSYFGAKPTGNSWTEIYKTAERWAKWSNFVGQNLWLQSIANYQHVMWPTDLIPGFAPSDEDAFGLLGPVSPYDPYKKDIMRLLLLMAEKHNISFVGELVMPASGYIKEALDQKFSGAKKIPDDDLLKPWLIVSDDGKTGGKSAFQPYFNPLHPKVQLWVESIFKELALRYKDSPSFDGLAIRLMGWSFASWQAFPSIHWGYGDFTIKQFEQDTGIIIPVSNQSSDRFKSRYEWLIKNQYDAWVNWRVSSITSYHKRLHDILKSARPDLKLYINTFGPDFSQSDWGKYGGWQARYKKLGEIGWYKMLRETGIDPISYKDEDGIVFSNSLHSPAGMRAQYKARGRAAEQYASLQLKESQSVVPITLSMKNKGIGSIAAVRFGNEYMEYDFPVKWIGYDALLWRKLKKFRIAAAINPAGRNILQKYAWALSKGNINFMTDGGLGYVLGDPEYTRPFMREYFSLPDIGMKKLSPNSTSSAIAVWYGNKVTDTYIYLVNVSAKQATTLIHFPDSARFTRIVTGEIYTADANNTIELSLKPYELVVLEAKNTPIKPISYDVK